MSDAPTKFPVISAILGFYTFCAALIVLGSGMSPILGIGMGAFGIVTGVAFAGLRGRKSWSPKALYGVAVAVVPFLAAVLSVPSDADPRKLFLAGGGATTLWVSGWVLVARYVERTLRTT